MHVTTISPRAALLARREELARAIIRREDIAIERYPDRLDNALQTAVRAERSAALDRLTRQLEAIDAALERIMDGTYGICMDCEKPISARRLEVAPHAARCVRCQEAAERENRSGE